MSAPTIAVVMTVFNRKEKTRHCILSLLAAAGNRMLSFFITDDGCTDGTNQMLLELASQNPDVQFEIIHSDGNLFWCRGMHAAFSVALAKSFDYYLWVNDDVDFQPDFLDTLLQDAQSLEQKPDFRPYLICGSVYTPGTQDLTYGGALNLSKTNPYRRKWLYPNGELQACHCINGNCVLIPRSTAILTGNLESRYEHGFGDFDYGYTLISRGGQPYVASRFVGSCSRNSIKGTWADNSLPIRKRIQKKHSPNGLPYASHNLFLKKWFPAMRLWHLWKPYLHIVLGSLKHHIGGK